MSSEQNKLIVSRYVEEVGNKGDLTVVDQYIASDYTRHDTGVPMEVRGPEGIRQLMAAYHSAFPDFHVTAEHLLAEGDLVVARWSVRGTQQGDLLGMPPTGKPITMMAIEVFRIAGGKIAEQWVAMDNLEMLRQLGAVPAGQPS